LSAFETAAAGTVVDTANFTAVPATVSTINFSDTTGFVVGLPIRLIQASVAKYYVVTAVVSNVSVTFAGPELTAAVNVTEIAILATSRVVQVDLFVPGGYDLQDDTSTLLLRNTRSSLRWQLPAARLVRASFAHNTPGSGTQPNVNASIAGTAVFSDNTNAGALMSGSANTWVSIGAGTAQVANYAIAFGDALELVLNAGANLDARDLSASLVFVLE
jgi:hypothetical protein